MRHASCVSKGSARLGLCLSAWIGSDASLAGFMDHSIKRDRSGRTVTFTCEAPAGQVWRATNAHELVSSCFTGNRAWEREALADIKADMALGLEPCAEADCDWCQGL